MSAIDQIAYNQGRRDEVPNQELARKLVETGDNAGIVEIAAYLWDKNANIRSDCLKVLYETGYLRPEMIAGYADDFLRLLRSKNNRLVWGGMIALSTIAGIKADELYPHVAEIKKTMQAGSVITVDAGVKTLAGIACNSPERGQEILPYLLDLLGTCRPKDVARHAESILPAVDEPHRSAFLGVLNQRMGDLSAAQVQRVRKVIRQVDRLEQGG